MNLFLKYLDSMQVFVVLNEEMLLVFLANKPRRAGRLHKVVHFFTCLAAEFLSCMCHTHNSNLNLYQF